MIPAATQRGILSKLGGLFMILQVEILLYFKGILPKKFQNQNGEIVTKNTQY